MKNTNTENIKLENVKKKIRKTKQNMIAYVLPPIYPKQTASIQERI